MEILGFVMALVIGLSLGLIGGGGSILAVPVLTYMFSYDEKVSTAYSLFIVGIAALLGGLKQNKSSNVDWRTAVVFGLPAMVGVWAIRQFLIPVLPDVLFPLFGFDITRRMGMLGLLSIMMLMASYSMITDKKKMKGVGIRKFNYPLIITEGILVGSFTGFVGAGGGFLIIPALVVLADLEIKKAIGTSLIIIAMKSLMGFFLGDAIQMQIDWNFLLFFSAITIVGMFIGTYVGKHIDSNKIKKGFGYFILLMGVFIFIMEFFIKQT